eukprot:SAG25_NODE_275_length_10545_cov_4.715968_7_plen_88_part_00
MAAEAPAPKRDPLYQAMLRACSCVLDDPLLVGEIMAHLPVLEAITLLLVNMAFCVEARQIRCKAGLEEEYKQRMIRCSLAGATGPQV